MQQAIHLPALQIHLDSTL